MSFAEIAEVAFQNGPKWCRGFAPIAKFTILFGLFLTYFGTCSVYTVIVARNFEQVCKIQTQSQTHTFKEKYNFSLYLLSIFFLFCFYLGYGTLVGL